MKQRLKRLSVVSGYILLAIGIIGATIVLVAMGRGYIYDLETGEIMPGGLVLLDSEPDDARIYVADDPNGTTPERLLLPSGNYQLRLEKDGYRTWQKTVPVFETEVTYAGYPLLIPDNVPTEPIADLKKPGVFAQSADQEKLAYVEYTPRPRVRLLRASGSAQPQAQTLLTLLEDLSNYRITAMEWAPGNRHLLLELHRPGSSRYLLLETEGDQTLYNLNQRFEGTLGEVEFGRTWDELFSLQQGRLQRLDVAIQSQEVVAQGIQSYVLAGERIVAVQKTGSRLDLVVIVRDQLRRLLPRRPNRTYSLEFLRYEDQPVLVVHDQSFGQVTLVRKPFNEPKTQSLPPRAAQEISISPNQRFLVLRQGNDFMTYDMEQRTITEFTLSAKLAHLHWYDGYHLLGRLHGDVVLLEFDGANIEVLAQAASGPVFGNAALRQVYSIGENAFTEQPVLQRSGLE